MILFYDELSICRVASQLVPTVCNMAWSGLRAIHYQAEMKLERA